MKVRTVKQVSEMTNVSIRTLRYYDKIGLLLPAKTTEAGYRLYDDAQLIRLQQILLFRELEFPLAEIKEILDSDSFDEELALEQQIKLLTLKREHLDELIAFAEKIKSNKKDNKLKNELKERIGGIGIMDFKAFDTKKIEEYAKEAKAKWGETDAYKEYENKANGRGADMQEKLSEKLMKIFAEFGEIKDLPCDDEKAQKLVKALQDFITQNYYTCTNQVLKGLGQMYCAGGEMTDNIDTVGGKGTANFVAEAIEKYTK